MEKENEGRPSRGEEEKRVKRVVGIPPFLIHRLDGPDWAGPLQIC